MCNPVAVSNWLRTCSSAWRWSASVAPVMRISSMYMMTPEYLAEDSLSPAGVCQVLRRCWKGVWYIEIIIQEQLLISLGKVQLCECLPTFQGREQIFCLQNGVLIQSGNSVSCWLEITTYLYARLVALEDWHYGQHPIWNCTSSKMPSFVSHISSSSTLSMHNMVPSEPYRNVAMHLHQLIFWPWNFGVCQASPWEHRHGSLARRAMNSHVVDGSLNLPVIAANFVRKD